MKRVAHIVGFALAFPILFFTSRQSCGQGTFETVHITFEGPPPQPAGTGQVVQEYYESGMSFTPIDPNAPWSGFTRSGGGIDFFPENGTAYLLAGLTDTLKFSFTNGVVFCMLSVDLAEFSTVVPDAVTVRFVGYRHDGTIVTNHVTTDGIIDGTGPLADFETFYFSSPFTDLDRVEIPTYGWSLDNLVVSRNVPEPSTLALFVGGCLLLTAVRYRTGRK